MAPPARAAGRPTGTVPWADTARQGRSARQLRPGAPIQPPQSPAELGRFLLDAFRRNLEGPR
jgi:hypothetical protein